MLKRSKRIIYSCIVLIGILIIFLLIYSVYRDEWYRVDVQDISRNIECSSKDVLGIYNAVLLELKDELIGYELVEIELTLENGLQEIEFYFYKPGFFCDVKSKKVEVLPKINCIKSIMIYEGNLKAYGGMVNSIDIENLKEINPDNIFTEDTKRVVYNEFGVRTY